MGDNVSQKSPHIRESLGSGMILRLIGALGVAALLLCFLVVARMFDKERTPDMEIRVLDTADYVAPPEPLPPVPELAAPIPPPPPPPKLPKLEVTVMKTSPAMPTSPERRVDLAMNSTVFEWEADPVRTPAARPRSPSRTVTPRAPQPPSAPKLKTVYSARELDSKPRLLNRPTAPFPSVLRKRGVREGRVTLEVSVSTSGRVTVRRVISASHPEFAAMARTVAARARFSVPKKNGRAVTAIYNWPLVLQP